MKKIVSVLLVMIAAVYFTPAANAYNGKITAVSTVKKLDRTFEINFDIKGFSFSTSDCNKLYLTVWEYSNTADKYVIDNNRAETALKKYDSENGIITKIYFDVKPMKTGDIRLLLCADDIGLIATDIVRIVKPGILSIFFDNIVAVFIVPLKMMIYTPLQYIFKKGFLPLVFFKESTVLSLYNYLAQHKLLMILAIIAVLAVFIGLVLLKLYSYSKSKTKLAYLLNIITAYFFTIMMAMRTNDTFELYKTADAYDDYTKSRVVFWYTIFTVICMIAIFIAMLYETYSLSDILGLMISIAFMIFIYNFIGIVAGIWILFIIISCFVSSGEGTLEVFALTSYLASITVDEWLGLDTDPYRGWFS